MNLRSVLICDIVNSSVFSDTQRVQLDLLLSRLFSHFNYIYHDYLAAEFDLTIGDEFEAVFLQPQDAIKPAFLMRAWLISQTSELSPKLRVAIGIGKVFVTRTRTPRRQDGPAFHIARRLIDRLKLEKRSVGIACNDNSNFISVINELIDTTLLYIDDILSRWTTPQWEAAYWRWQYKSLEETASILNISFQSVHKRLKSARFDMVDDGINRLIKILSNSEISGLISEVP
jgi:SatD family protein